jgi:hypothetical protein
MNGSDKRNHPKRNLVKPLVLACALAFSAGTALAASMTDIVTTRSDQNIDEQYGRESVFAFSPDAKPLKPEQTGQGSNVFGAIGGFFGATWDRVTGLFSGFGDDNAASQTAMNQPEELRGYGRAGGFVGGDRVAVLNSDNPYVANSDLVIVGDTIVGTGGGTHAPMSQSDVADLQQDQSQSAVAPSVEGSDVGTGERFDEAQSADMDTQSADMSESAGVSGDQSGTTLESAAGMDEPLNPGTQSGSNLAQ